MPGEIVEWLGSQPALEGITFLTEFPPLKKAVPLRTTIVAVGIEEMTITDRFISDENDQQVEDEYCRNADIKIKLSIHAPFSLGGAACHDAFTNVIDCLTFASNFDITQSGCESITADRDTDAFVLKACIEISASFCPAVSSSVSFASFINKDLLCGSHINNADIHLTAAQSDYLSSPIVAGVYFGTGDSVRTVSLGYRPRAVILFGDGLPPMKADHSTSTNTTLFAIAGALGGSQGLEITDNGFKVKSGAEYTLYGSTPKLNDLGVMYHYLIFK